MARACERSVSGAGMDEIRDHCGARRVLFTTSVSPRATDHAKRLGAEIVDVGSLGVVGVGPLNEATKPEPLESDRKIISRL